MTEQKILYYEIVHTSIIDSKRLRYGVMPKDIPACHFCEADINTVTVNEAQSMPVLEYIEWMNTLK